MSGHRRPQGVAGSRDLRDVAGEVDPAPLPGAGPRGLRDRMAARHGHLTVTSVPGGTTARAVLPCE